MTQKAKHHEREDFINVRTKLKWQIDLSHAPSLKDVIMSQINCLCLHSWITNALIKLLIGLLTQIIQIEKYKKMVQK